MAILTLQQDSKPPIRYEPVAEPRSNPFRRDERDALRRVTDELRRIGITPEGPRGGVPRPRTPEAFEEAVPVPSPTRPDEFRLSAASNPRRRRESRGTGRKRRSRFLSRSREGYGTQPYDPEKVEETLELRDQVAAEQERQAALLRRRRREGKEIRRPIYEHLWEHGGREHRDRCLKCGFERGIPFSGRSTSTRQRLRRRGCPVPDAEIRIRRRRRNPALPGPAARLALLPAVASSPPMPLPLLSAAAGTPNVEYIPPPLVDDLRAELGNIRGELEAMGHITRSTVTPPKSRASVLADRHAKLARSARLLGTRAKAIMRGTKGARPDLFEREVHKVGELLGERYQVLILHTPTGGGMAVPRRSRNPRSPVIETAVRLKAAARKVTGMELAPRNLAPGVIAKGHPEVELFYFHPLTTDELVAEGAWPGPLKLLFPGNLGRVTWDDEDQRTVEVGWLPPGEAWQPTGEARIADLQLCLAVLMADGWWWAPTLPADWFVSFGVDSLALSQGEAMLAEFAVVPDWSRYKWTPVLDFFEEFRAGKPGERQEKKKPPPPPPEVVGPWPGGPSLNPIYRLDELADIKLGMRDADFWIWRRHRTLAGAPAPGYHAQRIGIKVARRDLLNPDYLRYAFEWMHRTGRLPVRSGDSVTVRDIKKIQLDMQQAARVHSPRDPDWQQVKRETLGLNPSRSPASRMFEDWHEFGPDGDRDLEIPDPPSTGVYLGRLVEVVYESPKWEQARKGRRRRRHHYSHRFDNPRPFLVTDPDGRHLYIAGGMFRAKPEGLVG